MKSSSLTSHDKKQILKILDALSPSFVYLFGSASQNQLRPQSDIDLAFYHPQKIDPFIQLEIREQLASYLHRDVDLIELSQANDVIRAQVIGRGQVLEAQDQNTLHAMQIQWLKQYVMLNRERKPIIDRIQREGQIYG